MYLSSRGGGSPADSYTIGSTTYANRIKCTQLSCTYNAEPQDMQRGLKIELWDDGFIATNSATNTINSANSIGISDGDITSTIMCLCTDHVQPEVQEVYTWDSGALLTAT